MQRNYSPFPVFGKPRCLMFKLLDVSTSPTHCRSVHVLVHPFDDSFAPLCGAVVVLLLEADVYSGLKAVTEGSHNCIAHAFCT
jgi:hypothetical protein